MNYWIRIDGEWTKQDRLFTRGDMSFWGFSLEDVMPPYGHTVDLDENQEPIFVDRLAELKRDGLTTPSR